MIPNKPISYQDAGVSIDEGDRAVGYIKDLAKQTFTKGDDDVGLSFADPNISYTIHAVGR